MGKASGVNMPTSSQVREPTAKELAVATAVLAAASLIRETTTEGDRRKIAEFYAKVLVDKAMGYEGFATCRKVGER